MANITLADDLIAQIKPAVKELGLRDEGDFVTWAVRSKLLELRKKVFNEITEQVKAGLAERDSSTEDILKDFEKARHAD